MSFTAVISANIKDFESNLQKAQNQMDAFDKKIGVSVASIGRAIEGVGKKMSILSAGIVAGLGASVKASIDFETAFAGVIKTVDGTAKQLDTLKQGIIDMSKAIPASTAEISAVAEAAGQLGIETDRVLEFTRTMIDLGESTNLSSNEAATALARFANITRMSQTDFDRLGSTIVALGNNFATTESEIADMALRLAGAGSQVGLTEAEILSLATALSSVGIQSEAGGSAFSRLLSRMQIAVETGNEELENFASVAGVSAQKFANAFRGNAVDALNLFIRGLSDTESNGASAIAVLDQMGISDIRLRDAILRASGASDIFTDAVKLGNQAWEENNALATEAGRRYETTASQIKVLRNNLADVGRVIGDILLPTVNKIVISLKGMLNEISQLNPAVLKTGIIIAGVVAALGPLLIILGKVLQYLPLIKASIAALTGPIGIVSAAVVVMAINFHKNIDAMRTDWDFLHEHMRTTSAAFGDVISGNFSGWWTKVSNTFTKNIDYLREKWSQFIAYFNGEKGDGFTIDQKSLEAALAANEMTGMAGAIEIPVKLTADQLEIERLKEKIRLLNEQLANSKAEAVGTTNAFEKLISGLTAREAITATTLAIEELQSRIVKLQTGILPTSNLTYDLTEANKQLSELTAGLDLLTGGREINIDVKMNTDGISATGIDTTSFIDKIKQFGSDAQASLTEGFEGMLATTIDYGQMLSSGLTDVAGAIGDALGSGNFKDLGKGLIESMGRLAQQFGSLLIGMGTAALNLQTTLITQPWLAIAAGAALVALGAAATASAKRMVSNATSGGGGAASYQTTTPTYGPSEYRGAYRDEWAGNVTFKIGNNELVGVLEQANNRKNRI